MPTRTQLETTQKQASHDYWEARGLYGYGLRKTAPEKADHVKDLAARAHRLYGLTRPTLAQMQECVDLYRAAITMLTAHLPAAPVLSTPGLPAACAEQEERHLAALIGYPLPDDEDPEDDDPLTEDAIAEARDIERCHDAAIIHNRVIVTNRVGHMLARDATKQNTAGQMLFRAGGYETPQDAQRAAAQMVRVGRLVKRALRSSAPCLRD